MKRRVNRRTALFVSCLLLIAMAFVIDLLLHNRVGDWGGVASVRWQFFNRYICPLMIGIGVVGILSVVILSTIPSAKQEVKKLDDKEEGK